MPTILHITEHVGDNCFSFTLNRELVVGLPSSDTAEREKLFHKALLENGALQAMWTQSTNRGLTVLAYLPEDLRQKYVSFIDVFADHMHPRSGELLSTYSRR